MYILSAHCKDVQETTLFYVPKIVSKIASSIRPVSFHKKSGLNNTPVSLNAFIKPLVSARSN